MADDKKRPYRPWLPVIVIDGQPTTHLELRKSDVAALQAVAAGIANEGQQKQAIAAILHMAAINDLEFLPDEHGGDRGGIFKGGMRHLGLQLRKLLTHPLNLLSGDTDGQRAQPDRRTGKPADTRNAGRAKQ